MPNQAICLKSPSDCTFICSRCSLAFEEWVLDRERAVCYPSRSTEPNTVLMDQKLREFLPLLETKWGTRPRCVLAFQGSSDEHWQIFNPYDTGMGAIPRYAIGVDGLIAKIGDDL